MKNPTTMMKTALMLVLLGSASVVTAQPVADEVIQDTPDQASKPQRRQVAGPGSTFARAKQATKAGATDFEGYDFGQVVETLETSVDPLQREMNASFKVFADSIKQAEQLLDEGKSREAVETCSAALDGVLAVRQTVLDPMWDGQEFLSEQVGKVRKRLAKAVQAGNKNVTVTLDAKMEATLDGIAKRVASETDPLRKKRLVAHYRTVRNLAQIKRMAEQMSPDQRKLWTNVLHVLEEATLAHQQVLMGSEVLFAQFEATSANLREYLSLMDTVDGASRLLGMVNGVEGQAGGMAGFAKNMGQLQTRLATFNDALEQSLQSSMFELEAQVDALQPVADGDGSGVVSAEIDHELNSRLQRIQDGK